MEYEHAILNRNLEPSPTYKTIGCSAFVKGIRSLDVSDVTMNQSVIPLVPDACFIKQFCRISLI